MNIFRRVQWAHPWIALASILLVGGAWVFLLDSLVFRSSLYYQWLDPDSTAGSAFHETQAARTLLTGKRNVLVIGDSRLREGFSASSANLAAASGDQHFVALTVPGSGQVTWYYVLREIDPATNRLAAVGIGLAALRDDDLWSAETSDLGVLEIAYLAPFLRLGDLASLPWPFARSRLPWIAARAILLPGQAMQPDFLRFLQHPLDRIDKVTEFNANYRERQAGYQANPGHLPPLAALTSDPKALIAGPSSPQAAFNPAYGHLKQGFRWYFQRVYHRATPEGQAYVAQYTRYWLGTIAESYAAHKIPVIVFQFPRGPYHRELVGPLPAQGSLVDLERAGLISLLPADAFVDMEQPQYFVDYYHLNTDGRRLFTPLLAKAITDALARRAENRTAQ